MCLLMKFDCPWLGSGSDFIAWPGKLIQMILHVVT